MINWCKSYLSTPWDYSCQYLVSAIKNIWNRSSGRTNYRWFDANISLLAINHEKCYCPFQTKWAYNNWNTMWLNLSMLLFKFRIITYLITVLSRIRTEVPSNYIWINERYRDNYTILVCHSYESKFRWFPPSTYLCATTYVLILNKWDA